MDPIPRVPKCPFCTIRKIGCLRDPTTNECSKCQGHSKNESNRPLLFKIDELEAQGILYADAPYKSLPTLDVDGNDFYTLIVYVTPSAGTRSEPYTFDIAGPFTIENDPLVAWLVRLAVENFAIAVHGIGESAGLIHDAILAGALLHFICSSILITEQASTTINGFDCDNLHEQQSLGIHLRYLAICLFKRTVDHIMSDICIGDWFRLSERNRQAMFTTMAVLQSEMRYFSRNLDKGNLSRTGHLSTSFRQFLINGLLSTEAELDGRLRAGCAQFLDWQSSIQESIRKLRRVEETFALSLSLHQFKFTDVQPQQAMQIYTPQGNGASYLWYPPSAPIPKFAALSYDTVKEIDQLSDHVSGPLSINDDEEAAVLASLSSHQNLADIESAQGLIETSLPENASDTSSDSDSSSIGEQFATDSMPSNEAIDQQDLTQEGSNTINK